MFKIGVAFTGLVCALGFARAASADASLLVRLSSDRNVQLYTGPYKTLFRDPGTSAATSRDWAYGDYKAECGPYQATYNSTYFLNMLVGVSNYAEPYVCGAWWTGWFGANDCFRVAYQGLLCASTGSLQVSQYNDTRLFALYGNDQRDTTWGDWAYGYVKAECGPTQVVTGLSLSTMDVMCSEGLNLRSASNCNVRWADHANSQPSYNRGDWDYGSKKAECNIGEYVKGVAISDKQYKAILCCTPVLN